MDKQKETQVASVAGIWFGAVILLATLFISAGLQGAFTTTHIVFVGLILALAMIGTPLAIYGIRDKPDVAKAKRQRVDAMLRDMSDDELLELKQRLSDGNYNEESLLDYLDDDGEMVMRG
jgi:NhaP-type Na+/H+ and K+/H+ antiporter